VPLVSAGTRLTAALLSEDYSQTDISTFVFTASTTTQCTNSWTIPANDASIGTTYRLTAMGLGTQGSSTTALKFNMKPAGAVQLATQLGFIAVSAPFQWRLTGELVVTTTGSSGTAMGCMSLNVGNTQSTAGNYACAAFTQSFTFNTTIANAFFYQGFWSSSGNSATATCYSSIFERLGG
jgi:hypothetical protein